MSFLVNNSVIQCNTTAQVMCRISPQRAISMIMSGSAISIQDTDHIVHSQYVDIAIPSIIMLTQYVDEFEVHHAQERYASLRVAPSHSDRYKRAILRRDSFVCAYCGDYGDTIDHIIPQSKGGSWEWDNVIASCSSCNGIKGDKFLTELGWTLLYEPRPLSQNRYEKEQRLVFDALQMVAG